MATIKQKLAFKEVLKGSSLSKAMKKVGYADTTASTTGKLTNTKGWHELIDKYISEEELLKVHKEGLEAYKIEKGAVIGGEVGLASTEIKVPDFSTRHKYLETGYKVRGRLNEKEERGGDTTYNTLIIDSSQVERIIRRATFGSPKSEATPDRLLDSNEPKV